MTVCVLSVSSEENTHGGSCDRPHARTATFGGPSSNPSRSGGVAPSDLAPHPALAKWPLTHLLACSRLPGRARSLPWVSPARLAAAPIADFRLFVPLVTSAGTYITACATLARFSQPIPAPQDDRVAAYHACPTIRPRTSPGDSLAAGQTSRRIGESAPADFAHRVGAFQPPAGCASCQPSTPGIAPKPNMRPLGARYHGQSATPRPITCARAPRDRRSTPE